MMDGSATLPVGCTGELKEQQASTEYFAGEFQKPLGRALEVSYG